MSPTAALDFNANTLAITTTCAPITRRCIPDADKSWPGISNGTFTCAPGLTANFTYSGRAQMQDLAEIDGGHNSNPSNPVVGIGFAPDTNPTRKVGKYVANLTGILLEPDGGQGSVEAGSSLIGSNWSYQYLLPKTTLDFAIWASGYPILDPPSSVYGITDYPLRNDSQVLNDGTMTYWMLVSGPLAIQAGPATIALNSIASLAGAQNSSADQARIFSNGWSEAALALSIGAYRFTHPAETEVVKAQLSTKGLAAAHFESPGLLQQNVVQET